MDATYRKTSSISCTIIVVALFAVTPTLQAETTTAQDCATAPFTTKTERARLKKEQPDCYKLLIQGKDTVSDAQTLQHTPPAIIPGPQVLNIESGLELLYQVQSAAYQNPYNPTYQTVYTNNQLTNNTAPPTFFLPSAPSPTSSHYFYKASILTQTAPNPPQTSGATSPSPTAVELQPSLSVSKASPTPLNTMSPSTTTIVAAEDNSSLFQTIVSFFKRTFGF